MVWPPFPGGRAQLTWEGWTENCVFCYDAFCSYCSWVPLFQVYGHLLALVLMFPSFPAFILFFPWVSIFTFLIPCFHFKAPCLGMIPFILGITSQFLQFKWCMCRSTAEDQPFNLWVDLMFLYCQSILVAARKYQIPAWEFRRLVLGIHHPFTDALFLPASSCSLFQLIFCNDCSLASCELLGAPLSVYQKK